MMGPMRQQWMIGKIWSVRACHWCRSKSRGCCYDCDNGDGGSLYDGEKAWASKSRAEEGYSSG